MNISGVVVKVSPEHLGSVIESLRASGLCELHFHDEAGTIIVTIEGESTGEEVQKMKAILNIPNVLCASLAYSYCGEETGKPADRVGIAANSVPEVLKE